MRARALLRSIMIGGFAALTAFSAGAEPAPRVVTALPSPLPLPYSETANAKADVVATLARAKASGKHVLLDFGGNWCPDCRILAGVLELDEVDAAVAATFEVAMIDVGRFNKNLDLAAAYGVKVTAVPTVIVLDPQGNFVNAGHPTALSNARAMKPQAIVDTIFGWVAEAK